MTPGSIDWQICDELTECPAGMTVIVLANELGASPKSVYQALSRLEKQGLVVDCDSVPRSGQTGRRQRIWKMQRTIRSAA